LPKNEIGVAKAVDALKRILKKSPHKVGVEEAADMACEFQLQATIALRALEPLPEDNECSACMGFYVCPTHRKSRNRL